MKSFARTYRQKIASIPRITVGRRRTPYLKGDFTCRKLNTALMDYGAVMISHEGTSMEYMNAFRRQMERYFAQPDEVKMEDARPELGYQVGICPEYTEIPRDHSAKLKSMGIQLLQKPSVTSTPDPKWRFLARFGPRPENTKFPELNADPVIPRNFPVWDTLINLWGEDCLQVGEHVLTMIATGFGVEPEALLGKMRNGPHLVAPTGIDMRGRKLGSVTAGFHYDMNLLTIHGPTRYTGLYCFTPEGEKYAVPRCTGKTFLVQAGMQLEYLTGGKIKRGYHEVIVDEAAQKTVKTVAR